MHQSCVIIFSIHNGTPSLPFPPRLCKQVFGMVWQQEDYTVYQRWNNTQDQLSEIVTFAVAGFEECGDRQLEP